MRGGFENISFRHVERRSIVELRQIESSQCHFFKIQKPTALNAFFAYIEIVI